MVAAFSFTGYVALSTVALFTNAANALISYDQFYPAAVFLTTDKVSLAILYNFAFVAFLTFGKLILLTFIGRLRDLEFEELVETGRRILADTILFLVFYSPTINNKEVATVYLIQAVCGIIFMKVFHLITQIRVTHMFEVGMPKFIANVKIIIFIGILLTLDVWALAMFADLASKKSTFYTWVVFEAVTMIAMVLGIFAKFSIHIIDMRLESGWQGKEAYLFYTDLICDLLNMTIFLTFMLTFFLQNPSRLPMYMISDVLLVVTNLTRRLKSFRRYRQILANIDRFPDATEEEMDQTQMCIICRDELWEGSKKLPCGHIFHLQCLKSWLLMQQTCPTCRKEVPVEPPPIPDAAPTPAPGAAAADPAAPPPAGSPARGASAATAVSPAGQPPPGAPHVLSGGVAAAIAAAQARQPGATAVLGPFTNQVDATRVAEAQRALLFGRFANMAPPMPGGGNAEGMGPEDMVECMTYAKNMAHFMREQANFWMENVQSINHGQGGGIAPPPTSIPEMPTFLRKSAEQAGAAPATSSTTPAPPAAKVEATVGVTPAKPQQSSSNPTANTTTTTNTVTSGAAETKPAAPKVFLPSTVKPKPQADKVNADTSSQSQEQQGGYSLQGETNSSSSSQPQTQAPDMTEIARLRAARFEKQKEEQS